MEKSGKLFVEMMGDSGVCSQKCPHCPHGRKEEEEVFSFPKPALELLALLQKYNKLRGENIDVLNVIAGGAKKFQIEPWPLDPFPTSLAFSLGNIFENKLEEDFDIEEIIIRNVELIKACLGDQLLSKDGQINLLLNLTTAVNDKLEWENKEFLIYYFRRVLLHILKKWPGVWNDIHFALSSNAVSKESFQFSQNEPSKRLLRLAEMQMFLKAIAGKLPILAEDLRHFYNDLAKWATYGVHLHINDNLKLTLSERVIQQVKEHKKETYLRESEWSLMLLPDQVWVEHTTGNTQDMSVRLEYEEVAKIIEKAAESGENIQKRIFDRVREKRKQVLKVLG